MTDLEKIKRAKMYMDKLANGINPIDDTLIPDEDIINNVRLSRCFFFVSDVLRQVIESDYLSNQPLSKQENGTIQKKLPLNIPPERRAAFAFSATPITASELAKRINALIDVEAMQKLSHRGITEWLSEIGMLTWTLTITGKRAKHPTSQGTKCGILVENRTGSNGAYQVVLYNLSAQHFIIDNLDSIIAAENLTAALSHQPWTAAHDECLVDLYKKGVSLSEIAITLKRNTSAVRARIKKLGLLPKTSDV